ncbi:4590_t:CDS:2 [Ambispora leptoticha]|uniref:4590_t:CDS:1 n=1 Tax=Ambispora leptoticha TaxID=144679 RepID=A0A9N9F3J0_9GLOM|nr:4590_t:CDS:2 [Ambispora leptoticha]
MVDLSKFFIQYYLWGITTMCFFNNSCLSLVYLARQANLSNLLKLLFNLSGLGKLLLSIINSLSPATVETTCLMEGYMTNFVNSTFRSTLSAFLLWRVRVIGGEEKDLFIGLTLWMPSAVLMLARTFIIRYDSTYIPAIASYICYGTTPHITVIFQWIFVAFDFAIDIFVTIRLCQILDKANKNTQHVTQNMRKPFKRTLFTSVKYWNFIRLFLAIFYHVMSTVQATIGYTQIDQLTMTYIFTFIFLALSFIITTDAEIVRAIEGRKTPTRKQETNKDENQLRFSNSTCKCSNQHSSLSTKTSSSQSNDYINENQKNPQVDIQIID